MKEESAQAVIKQIIKTKFMSARNPSLMLIAWEVEVLTTLSS